MLSSPWPLLQDTNMAQNPFMANVREPFRYAVLNTAVNRHPTHLCPIHTAVDEDIRMRAGITGGYYHTSCPCDVHDWHAFLKLLQGMNAPEGMYTRTSGANNNRQGRTRCSMAKRLNRAWCQA